MNSLVFISYATADSELYQIPQVATRLALRSDIAEVLYWEEHMHDDIYQYMNDNLGRCQVLLLFCSENATNSEAVRQEWMAALKLKKKIIPVFLEEADIPPLLTTKLGVPFDNSDLDTTVTRLGDLITKKQKGPLEIEERPAQSAPTAAKVSVEELANLAHNAIFNNRGELRIGEESYPIDHYPKSKIRYVNVKHYKFMEQNPKKDSKYGRLARDGHKILWVMKKGNFFARIIDDDFEYC